LIKFLGLKQEFSIILKIKCNNQAVTFYSQLNYHVFFLFTKNG